jgi:hypothetical protein
VEAQLTSEARGNAGRARLSLPVLMGAALLPLAPSAHEYRIGEQREAQQANFCRDLAEVDDIASLFERFGARTGFSALSASQLCTLEVHSFVPRRLHREVTIPLSNGGEYTVRFIEVDLASGESRILVTTRELQRGP